MEKQEQNQAPCRAGAEGRVRTPGAAVGGNRHGKVTTEMAHGEELGFVCSAVRGAEHEGLAIPQGKDIVWLARWRHGTPWHLEGS